MIPENSRRLVILGCGWLGRAVAEKAIRRGIEVQALTRNLSTAGSLRKLGCASVIEADLLSQDWHSEIRPEEACVALTIGASGHSEASYRECYFEGVRAMLDWIGDARPNSLVFTSSTSVYPQSGGQWVDESASTEGCSATAGVLRESEDLLLGWANELGVPCRILRLAGLYGPERHRLIDGVKSGVTDYSGDEASFLNLVHQSDAAEAVLLAALADVIGAAGIFNVSDGNPSTKLDILQWTAEQLKIDLPELNWKGSSLRRGRAGLLPNRRIDPTRMQETFNWRPEYPSFREGYLRLLGLNSFTQDRR